MRTAFSRGLPSSSTSRGTVAEALEHYRRAYELMPSSFGRVESHCFGCESVFQSAEAQSIAEQVFTDIIRKSPEPGRRRTISSPIYASSRAVTLKPCSRCVPQSRSILTI